MFRKRKILQGIYQITTLYLEQPGYTGPVNNTQKYSETNSLSNFWSNHLKGYSPLGQLDFISTFNLYLMQTSSKYENIELKLLFVKILKFDSHF